MLGCVSEGRRSSEGHPADQARHHDAVRPPIRKSRVSADVEARPAPREFPWRMPAGWWTRKRHYFLYVVREFTALPLAIWLLWLLYDISQKKTNFGTAFDVLYIVYLPFSLYQSFTFNILDYYVICLKYYMSHLIFTFMFNF